MYTKNVQQGGDMMCAKTYKKDFNQKSESIYIWCTHGLTRKNQHICFLSLLHWWK